MTSSTLPLTVPARSNICVFVTRSNHFYAHVFLDCDGPRIVYITFHFTTATASLFLDRSMSSTSEVLRFHHVPDEGHGALINVQSWNIRFNFVSNIAADTIRPVPEFLLPREEEINFSLCGHESWCIGTYLHTYTICVEVIFTAYMLRPSACLATTFSHIIHIKLTTLYNVSISNAFCIKNVLLRTNIIIPRRDENTLI